MPTAICQGRRAVYRGRARGRHVAAVDNRRRRRCRCAVYRCGRAGRRRSGPRNHGRRVCRCRRAGRRRPRQSAPLPMRCHLPRLTQLPRSLQVVPATYSATGVGRYGRARRRQRGGPGRRKRAHQGGSLRKPEAPGATAGRTAAGDRRRTARTGRSGAVASRRTPRFWADGRPGSYGTKTSLSRYLVWLAEIRDRRCTAALPRRAGSRSPGWRKPTGGVSFRTEPITGAVLRQSS